MRIFFAVFLSILFGSGEAFAEGQPDTSNQRPSEQSTNQSICLMIESAARDHHLPLEFFARVIWQESRFQPNAIGPRTRSGEQARGISQFMPRTAAERGLLDPMDPVQALPESAEFLSELHAEFGNLGLAAAAYNAGAQRVRDFLAGQGGMPAETRSYVLAITGISIDDWAKTGNATQPPSPSKPGCDELMAMLKREPSPFMRELRQRVETAAVAPWGVQLSAGFSRDEALRSYASVARRYANLLQGKDPNILATRLLTRGTRTFYQVRIGADTRAAANQLCDSIRRSKGACLVLRNPRGAKNA